MDEQLTSAQCAAKARVFEACAQMLERGEWAASKMDRAWGEVVAVTLFQRAAAWRKKALNRAEQEEGRPVARPPRVKQAA
jgi:hypothetical protein